jgi:N-acyl homoserine lactone hydrolase
MSNWRITSLRLGELYLPHGGGIMRDPVHCWLVRNGETNILVDSGMAEIGTIRARLKVDGFGGGHEALRHALGKEGLTPDDVNFVILTHMHFDHADNLDLFSKACVVAQRTELMAAIDPVPSQRIFYWKSTIDNLMARKRPAEVRLVDGDADFMPGIRFMCRATPKGCRSLS